MKNPLFRLVPSLCGSALLLASSAEAKLLGYWNFDGPSSTSTSDRLKDKSGNGYHGRDPNYGGGTGVNRVFFNAVDVPRAPYLVPPGNTNYCLDLTGNSTAGTENNRYVVIEPDAAGDGSGTTAAAGAVDSTGNAFNLGNTTGTSVAATGFRFTVAFWYKGNAVQTYSNYVSKGGEAYGNAGKAFEGWAVRKNNTNVRMDWVTRGSWANTGDLDGGADYNNRSGGTLAAPSLNGVVVAVGNVANNTIGNITDNLAAGTWQHACMVWDGTRKHMYINGFHNKSETIAGATYIGTTAKLVFGVDYTTANAVNVLKFSRTRMDEICIYDEALTPGQVEDLARGASPLTPLRTQWRPFDFAMPTANPNLVPYNSAYPPAYAAGNLSPTGAAYPLSTGGLPANALDGNLATAYINLKGVYSGLMTTLPATNIVKSFTITTAAANPERDPATYELWGTASALTSADNSGGRAEAWTLIQSGALGLPATRGTTVTIPVTNSTTYLNYKIVFPTLTGATEKTMQIAEIQYFTSTDGTGVGLLLPASVARAIAEPTISNGQSWHQGAEQVAKVIDGVTTTKYLNTAGAGTGFIVTPAAASVVQSFRATTANDTPGRDPTFYAIYGTNDTIKSLNNTDGKAENWTLIQQGRLTMPFARTTLGPVVTLTNSTSYTSYKVVFPMNGGEVLFQLAEFQLYPTTDATGAGVLAPANPILGVAENYMGPLSVASFYAGYTGGPLMPQGGPGYMGIFEQRANGNLRRPDGSSSGNANVYTGDSPIMYARWGSLNAPSYTPGIINYPIVRGTTTSINFGDDNSSIATGYDGAQNEFLTSSIPAAQDNMVQMIQGCFRVTTPGKYTFTLRGDDGADLAIAGATWLSMTAGNNFGSIVGDTLQNHMTTGDTNNVAVVNFPTAGDYNFRYSYSEATGGAFNEVLYAQGEFVAYDAVAFKQLGDPAGGLSLVDHTPMMDIRSTVLLVTGGVPATQTLTWDAGYATNVKINGGAFANEDVTAVTLNGSGSRTLPTPATTTTYTITGIRGSGTPVTRSVTVYVNSPPVILTFAADDATLLPGAPLTLRWTSLFGTTFTLSNGVTNTNVTSNTTTAPDGTQSGFITIAAPAADTTYSLTATNTFAPPTVSTTLIDIGTGPTLTFTGDKATMLQGSFLTLNWTVTDGGNATITPRLNNSSLSTSVPNTGTSVEQPQLTTTYTLSASNIYGSSSATTTITMPERFGISPAGWTVQVDYWNRFGYTDPVFGIRNAHTAAAYQSDEMFAITDAALGDRGPLATVNTNTTTPALSGPAVPPNAQPGTGEKLLMRYRETGVAVINYDDAAAATGSIPGSVRPPPALTAGVTYDQYALKATATLVVNAPGDYTIGINNDDGGRLRIDLNNDGDFSDGGETLVQDETYHGFLGTLPLTSTVSLQAGAYPIEYMYFEGAGGSGGEVFFVDPDDQCRIKPLPIVSASPTAPVTTDVVISEFMAVNNNTLEDLEHNNPDWIELYNGTAAAISLNGYFLTDNAAIPNKWAFPNTASVPAGGYLIVFASGKATRIPPPPATEFHTNFTLGGGVGYVALKKSDGAGGYLNVSSFNYPNQRGDVSYGWYDGTNIGYSSTPTPGKLNMGGAASLVTGDTHFSVDRGIKTAAFSLEITASDTTPGTIIRYTTDGSIPTALNGQNYTVPIPISVTTAVRAIAMRAGAIPTNSDTQTYIFLDDVLTQNTVQALAKGWPNSIVAGQTFDFGMDAAIVAGKETEVKNALKAIPTVSVVTDITNLTDPNCGIFVESQFRGRAFERNCSVELLNDKGDLNGNFQIEAGIRSRGGFSRSDGNPKHSWHLYFRNDPGYGGRLKYSLYGTEGTNRFEQIDLATANNYSWSFAPENANLRTLAYTNSSNTTTTFQWRYNTFVRDLASRDLQIDMSGYGTRNKYVHLYINGIYWGLHYFQERAEASFGEEYFGGDKNNYDVIKSSGSTNGYQTEATDGDMTRGITGTATVDGNYQSAWAKFYGGALDIRQRNGNLLTPAAINDRNVRLYKLMGMDYNPSTQTATPNPAYPVLLDVNNLVDYILITCYAGAYDAPLSTFVTTSGSNNWTAMRDRAGNRGFRYFVWDFEHGLGTDMLSGDFTAGYSLDVDPSATSNVKFVGSTIGNATQASYRSYNRLGPWAFGNGAVTLNPRAPLPTFQQYRGDFSGTNPEYFWDPFYYNTGNDLARSNPQFLHEMLAFSSEYRRLFADRAQVMLRQGGPLTTPKVLARIDARKVQLENAVIAESARWGNAKGVALTNYDKNAWLAAVQNMKDWVIQGSNQHVLNSLPIYEAGGVIPRAGTNVQGPGRAELLISQLKAYKDGGSSGGFATVTTKALTSNVATITTNPAHGFVVGQPVLIVLNGADAVFDGTWTIASVPTPTTFTYARTNPTNVASAGAGGTVTPSAQNFTITNKALATNVTTLTTSSPHGYLVNQQVTVAMTPADAVFDGTYTITAVPTITTFSYAKTNANVTAVAAFGLVTPTTPPAANITGAAAYVVPNLFPSIDAPTLSLSGGVVPTNTTVTLTNPNTGSIANQTIYYSTIGVDPRPIGGGAPAGGTSSIGVNGTVSGNATLTVTGALVARVYDSVAQDWSALSRGDFIVGVVASAANFLITEMNYNPDNTTLTSTDGQSFEFVELQNISASPIDLTGVKFTTGITYNFPLGQILPAGERLVIVKDPVAFATRYPDASYPGLSAKVVGTYSGSLDNGGEQIVLKAQNGSDIRNFTYGDDADWPQLPDGRGRTLVFTCAAGGEAVSAGNDPANWFTHALFHGNPGGPDCTSYSAWAAANSASTLGDADTSDQDGVSDLLEYFFGGSLTSSSTDKMPFASVANLVVNNVAADYQVITFTRAPGTEDASFVVQISDDLTNPSWTNTAVLTIRTENLDGSVTFVYRAPLAYSEDNRNFMRVQVNYTP